MFGEKQQKRRDERPFVDDDHVEIEDLDEEDDRESLSCQSHEDGDDMFESTKQNQK